MVIHSYERPRNSALLKKIRDGITLTAEEEWEGAYNAKFVLTNIKLTGLDKTSGIRSLRSQLMRGTHLIHHFQAEMCTRVIKDMPGLCVPTFLLHELRGRKVERAKKMMLDDIVQGLDEQKGEDDEDGYSVDHIVGFLKANNLPVSLYAVDGWGKIFARETYVNKRSKDKNRVAICFMVKDNHLYPLCGDRKFAQSLALTSGMIQLMSKTQWSAPPDNTFVVSKRGDTEPSKCVLKKSSMVRLIPSIQ
jgi:hypothetical protein